MSIVSLKLPKLGESIKEATLLSWLKKEGEQVEKDEPILEVATDKVDSEIVAPASGILTKILVQENEIAKIGEELAQIEAETSSKKEAQEIKGKNPESEPIEENSTKVQGQEIKVNRFDEEGRFYSPLVRSMAEKEGISFEELKNLRGSGNNGRILKVDLQAYLQSGKKQADKVVQTSSASYEGKHEIVEMDRMRSMIAEHMVRSKQTSPHVTSYVEADVTDIVNWRNKVKAEFQKKYKEKITFTPIFVQAVVKALQEYPMVNVSVDGNQIIVKKDLNIGLATALPNGNLIVPVIRNADKKNLLGLTSEVNQLVEKARTNQLKPDDLGGSTFTLSNVGTFRNIMGTPVINQPEVAILATGMIRKRPAVVETEYGDVIAIRHMMYLSLSYDHRVVDGNLGGSFLARIGDHFEGFEESLDFRV